MSGMSRRHLLANTALFASMSSGLGYPVALAQAQAQGTSEDFDFVVQFSASVTGALTDIRRVFSIATALRLLIHNSLKDHWRRLKTNLAGVSFSPPDNPIIRGRTSGHPSPLGSQYPAEQTRSILGYWQLLRRLLEEILTTVESILSIIGLVGQLVPIYRRSTPAIIERVRDWIIFIRDSIDRFDKIVNLFLTVTPSSGSLPVADAMTLAVTLDFLKDLSPLCADVYFGVTAQDV
ncbi:MAG: hypothetical protein SF002_11510 [Alphaproteobacteria bacterium]|nr:hypothetical protein [Alphaproteobacteria bacterium]